MKVQTETMRSCRAALNVFGPWVLWPLVRYSDKPMGAGKDPAFLGRVETLTITILFFAIEFVASRPPLRTSGDN